MLDWHVPVTDKEQVNLTNCDREPIHIPGSIQRHGVMLVCDGNTQKVLFASANAASALGAKTSIQPGLDLEIIVGSALAHELRNASAKAQQPGSSSIVLNAQLPECETAFDISLHNHDDRCIIEFEPCVDGGIGANQAMDMTRSLIHRIGQEDSVDKIARSGARLVRVMLGYDRVMIYRFLYNGAGRVIAESKSPSLGSFLGQHFPASDIPAQARRLYLKNTIRMISDAAYEPIRLQPALGVDEPPVDMSFAQLRSVSPIHCEYLSNMGVAASLSISIVVDGNLWGLISCHHDTPKVTPVALRHSAELFGQFFSLQIALAERRAALQAATNARTQLDNMVAGFTSGERVASSLREYLPDFMSLVEADGAALWLDGEWSSSGDTLDKDTALLLMQIASVESPRAIWTTPELTSYLPGKSLKVAGALAIPLSITLGDYLMLFRHEEAHNVEWAGEPGKITVPMASGDRLTPRGSFETWREEVRGRSAPWAETHISVADSIGTFLRDVILRQTEISREERAQTEQRRRILNAELNHRVKNIIALVKSIALQTGASASSVQDYSSTLEGRLRALAYAHDQSLDSSAGGSLAKLIETEVSLHRHDASPERVTIGGPRLRLGERSFSVLALVVHEMMTNAAKYGALSVPEGKLAISWQLTPSGNCELRWQESAGPSVSRPSRLGFGTRLIRSSIEYDLRGRADLHYTPAGLEAVFVIPAVHISPDSEIEIKAEDSQTAPEQLTGLCVLVVEDQSLIALDTEDMLRRLGVKEVRLVATIEDALHEIESSSPDIAVLDFNLGATTSERVADALLARQIPFVFTTGYSDRAMISAHLRHIPIARKPVSDTSIAKLIHKVLQPARVNLA